jgi:DNA polymerase-3 subunit alpha
VLDISEARAQYARCLEICADSQSLGGRKLRELADVLSSHRGNGSMPVTLRYKRVDAEASLPLGESWKVQASDDLVLKLMDRFGAKAVALRY